MKFFIDTADMAEIEALAATGWVDGVTTNPSLVAQSGHKNFLDLIRAICRIVDGPVSAEVAATDFETMLREAEVLANLAENVAVKVPLTEAGLKVCRTLSNQGRMVNVTLCFSAAQALLAAKAGACFVSPFIGRLDDIGQDGMALIDEIMTIYNNYPALSTQVLAASIRTVPHVVMAAKMGAHVATIPPKILRQMIQHPLTDKGLAQFVTDWQKTGQKIL
jgi:transaldolase